MFSGKDVALFVFDVVASAVLVALLTIVLGVPPYLAATYTDAGPLEVWSIVVTLEFLVGLLCFMVSVSTHPRGLVVFGVAFVLVALSAVNFIALPFYVLAGWLF